MKKIVAIAICLACFTTSAWSAEKAPQQVINLANSILVELGTNPIIVASVKNDNAKGQSLAAIKELDAKWKAHAGIADYMQAIIANPCSKELSRIMDLGNERVCFMICFLY